MCIRDRMKSVKLDDNLSAFGGGVYVDGRYYMVLLAYKTGAVPEDHKE